MYIKNIIIVAVGVILLSGCGLKEQVETYEVPLDVWGTFDTSNTYSDIFAEYKKINPNIATINYHKQSIESYKKDLLDALASGTGPDIFMIQNSWLPDFQNKIVPVPSYMMTEQEFRNTFVDVVAMDAVVDGNIYGVPLSVDSLALYYNKDIMNAAGITNPPKTWIEFNNIVRTLVDVNEFGNINQSAAALGTAYNINKSMDVLTVIMMQNGTEMSNRQNNRISFADSAVTAKGTTIPGREALKYYTDFANAATPIYTWNKKQDYSIDAFVESETAMMINYSWHYDTIKAKNAKLNFAVTDLPQVALEPVGEQANFANYWLFVVAKNKQSAPNITDKMRIHESWQLLKAMTFPSNKGVIIGSVKGGEASIYPVPFDFTERYLEKTGKPAARRDLIDKQKMDIKLGPFVRGNLIAQSWWRSNPTAVDAIFADMIDSINVGKSTIGDAIDLGAQRTQQLLN
jgi:ABC-type glycerol-3-phosphate transport system substrate-binding protein